jgi:hypothetical protein
MSGQDMEYGRKLVLCILANITKLATAQLKRVLADIGAADDIELPALLARLVEEGKLRQSVSLSGVVYALTPSGEVELAHSALSAEKNSEIAQTAVTFKDIFTQEQNYLAQYTEQANAIIPVFLSIRKDEKVLFKISIIVNNVETAVKVKENWMKNANKAYEAVWEAIGEGEPMPDFH